MRVRIFAEKTLVLAVALAIMTLVTIMYNHVDNSVWLVIYAVLLAVFNFYVKIVRRHNEKEKQVR